GRRSAGRLQERSARADSGKPGSRGSAEGGEEVRTVVLLILISALSVPASASAADGGANNAANGAAKRDPAASSPGAKRGKSLEFDDNVVEGMNKNPLDSLQNVGREDGKTH